MSRATNFKPVFNSFVLLFYYCFIFLQTKQPRIKYYKLEDRLSQVCFNDLLLDKFGFVWIAKQDGLDKFEGIKFSHYKFNVKDFLIHSHSGNLINNLYEDNTNNIWVGTISNGLNYSNLELEIYRKTVTPRTN